jgi:hypothetical protein
LNAAGENEQSMIIFKVPKMLLEMTEQLLVYLRATPADVPAAKTLSEVGSLLGRQISEVQPSLKSLLSKFKFIRLSSESLVLEVAKEDIELLSKICLTPAQLQQKAEDGLVSDFADAFHGFPEALQNPRLNRSQYFDIYFQPFLKKWGSYMEKYDYELVVSWKKS